MIHTRSPGPCFEGADEYVDEFLTGSRQLICPLWWPSWPDRGWSGLRGVGSRRGVGRGGVHRVPVPGISWSSLTGWQPRSSTRGTTCRTRSWVCCTASIAPRSPVLSARSADYSHNAASLFPAVLVCGFARWRMCSPTPRFEGVELRLDATEVQVRRPVAGRGGRRAFVSARLRLGQEEAEHDESHCHRRPPRSHAVG